MFGPISRNVITDLLFNLLMAFISLFFLAFLMVNDPKDEEDAVQSNSNILITMRWHTDNDMDLHLLLPDGRGVWYSNRDEPPAHLDVDVVEWRRYIRPNGQEYVIENNEEIITIRGVFPGEYAVNVHYYNNQRVDEKEEIEVEVLVEDVKNRNVIYAGTKVLSLKEREVHFVKFTVTEKDLVDQNGERRYSVENIYTDRPVFFVGKAKSSNPGGRGPSDHYDRSSDFGQEE